ncbi:hypothetical protein FACS189431_7920 [Alphaproteobacteria bacterium]|nr:hypothetical protein FACS189431_7920 [Alphaproteobacteria bacterium]
MVESAPNQTQILFSSGEYLYPNMQPGDFVVLKKDKNKPLFNADIYDRTQVEEVVNVFGHEHIERHGYVLALYRHFGASNYKHREENVASLGDAAPVDSEYYTDTVEETNYFERPSGTVKDHRPSRTPITSGGHCYRDFASAAANDPFDQ